MLRQKKFEQKIAHRMNKEMSTPFVYEKTTDRRKSNSYLHKYEYLDREKPIASITDSPIKGSVSARVAQVQPPPDKLPYKEPFPPPLLASEEHNKDKNLIRRLSKKSDVGTPEKKGDMETIDDDRLHDIHNANGMFSCFCSVCFGASKKLVRNTLHKMP